MKFLKWLFPGSTEVASPEVTSPTSDRPFPADVPESEPAEGDQHAVLIWIDGARLSGAADDIDDIATLEDDLQDALQDEGEVDGHDIGSDDATLYFYGNSADRMFDLIRPVLESSTLANQALVTLRYGDPDCEDQREVQLGG